VLQPLPIANLETGSLSKVVKMGRAILDTTTCIPYALKQPCLACKEICPVEGAITTHGGEGRGKGGRVRKPEFNHDVCVGCGACEYVCHTVVKADAVKVSTEGVKRTPWEG
jgi:ferredoxin-type protein NapG